MGGARSAAEGISGLPACEGYPLALTFGRMNIPIVIESSLAEIEAHPARFFDALRAGHTVHVSDLGGTVAIVETDEEVEDMASLRSKTTGVENTIFVSTKAFGRHAARIKIAVDPPHTFNATSKSASMAIHDYGITGEYLAPRIVEQAKQFIELNRDALLDFWECKISTEDLIERLKPI
jgi:hypothetical protein